MKKLLSLVCVLAMAFALCVPAFADDAGPTATPGQLVDGLAESLESTPYVSGEPYTGDYDTAKLLHDYLAENPSIYVSGAIANAFTNLDRGCCPLTTYKYFYNREEDTAVSRAYVLAQYYNGGSTNDIHVTLDSSVFTDSLTVTVSYDGDPSPLGAYLHMWIEEIDPAQAYQWTCGEQMGDLNVGRMATMTRTDCSFYAPNPGTYVISRYAGRPDHILQPIVTPMFPIITGGGDTPDPDAPVQDTPTPEEPSPADPSPTEPSPTEPSPEEPSEPSPTEPSPEEPSEPSPTEPSPALDAVSLAAQLAANPASYETAAQLCGILTGNADIYVSFAASDALRTALEKNGGLTVSGNCSTERMEISFTALCPAGLAEKLVVNVKEPDAGAFDVEAYYSDGSQSPLGTYLTVTLPLTSVDSTALYEWSCGSQRGNVESSFNTENQTVVFGFYAPHFSTFTIRPAVSGSGSGSGSTGTPSSGAANTPASGSAVTGPVLAPTNADLNASAVIVAVLAGVLAIGLAILAKKRFPEK